MTELMEPETDGRRMRGANNRKKIVEAFLALVREGSVGPTAEMVAERAGVGLRTVFRHFEDMESLFAEMMAEVEAEALPIVLQPFRSPDWRGMLSEAVTRRARVYEILQPFRRAVETRRATSKVLAERYATFTQQQIALLNALIPEGELPPARMQALQLLLGAEAWSRLRREQGLGPEEAEAVIREAVFTIAGAPAAA